MEHFLNIIAILKGFQIFAPVSAYISSGAIIQEQFDGVFMA
ncbi:hypothetical protein [Pseudobacteroides cellulosolvens]|nr:hypothetical protein [Pseudobacteroides cellulosolvens]